MTGQEHIRINKVVKEFNIGINTVVEFLSKNGIEVENQPNAKISSEAYSLISKEFGKEQLIKKEAEKINVRDLTSTKTQKEKPNKEIKEDEEVIIKTNIMATKQEPAISSTPKEKKEEGPKFQGVKILGRIDLSTRKPVEKDTHANAAKKQKNITPSVKEESMAPDSTVRHLQKESSTVNRPAEKEAEKLTPVKETASEKATPEKQVIEHISTKVEKLAGPVISGTIDLSQFERKPSADKNKKGKRERIHSREKVDIAKEGARKNNNNNASGNASAHKQNNKQNQGGHGMNQNHGGNNPAGNNNTRKNKKEKFKPAVQAVEIDEDQIQKQIKETYARMTESKTAKTKGSKYRKEKRELFNQKLQEEMEMEELTSKVLKVTEFVTVNELAIMMDNTPVTKVIEACMNLGLMVSINQRLDAEALVLVAEEFGYTIEFVTADANDTIEEEVDNEEDLVERPPIITVMGHVDHGKTSLLDHIRNANVIAGEAGGITQHIGAYNVKLESGRRITFLDTPGHEAFTAMRARGAKITDVAIIIVAADDAIMPQTIEAINHAQAAGVPMVFAINKIDKPAAHPDKIREQLSNMNILVEEWGGKYQCQEISAKKGINVDKLLEKVLLEADLLELKANPNKRAKGTIIESSLDKGRGYLATVLVQNGTMRVGDFMLTGSYTGKVKAMFNERGQKVKEAGPSTPVSVLGLNGAPTAGETFNIMENEKEAKELANKREQLLRIQGLKTQKHITLEEIGRRIAIGNFQELNIIVKGDVDGSIEALSDSLIKLSTEEIHVNVIHKAVGAISESDVLLAAASNAIIIGFQVRPVPSARKLAETEEIEIRQYSVIYDAINEVKDGIEGMLAPVEKEVVIGTAEVRETFKISKVGTIGGCMVKDGKITRSSQVRVIRDGIVIYTGELGSLKRFKDDVKEVTTGFDCGLNVENFNDIKVGDIIEAYAIEQIKRKL